MVETTPQNPIAELLVIMRRLRDPAGGCPWDLEQDFATIAPYTIEEAYEVAAAIEHGDFDALKDELGDLLLQVVFHAQMAEEQGLFAFNDVAKSICSKMIRRHPHVFSQGDARNAADVARNWEDIKQQERAAKQGAAEAKPPGALDDVPEALPALMRAEKLQKRAARTGFDWPNVQGVTDKIAEEARELAEAKTSKDPEAISEEFGDLLFAVVNLGRHLGVDPETALRATNAKFVRRFRAIETGLAAQGKALSQATLDEMEAFWQQAKMDEKKNK
jgi:ATP diphosphatase